MHFRNNYTCLADLKHPTIREQYVDKKVTSEIVNVLLRSMRDPREASARLPEIEARLPQIDTEEAGWAEAQAGGMRWALIAPHMQALIAERKRLQEERTALLAASTRARVISDLRSALVDPVTRRVDMDAASELRREITRRFENLPIRERRELVAEHLSIVVHPGRGPGRVQVFERDTD
jgi:hypothetical protein